MTARAARFTKIFDKCGQVASKFRKVGHGGAQAVSERTDETHLLPALVPSFSELHFTLYQRVCDRSEVRPRERAQPSTTSKESLKQKRRARSIK